MIVIIIITIIIIIIIIIADRLRTRRLAARTSTGPVSLGARQLGDKVYGYYYYYYYYYYNYLKVTKHTTHMYMHTYIYV